MPVPDELRKFKKIFGIRLYSIEKVLFPDAIEQHFYLPFSYSFQKSTGAPAEPTIERYFALQKNRFSAQQHALKNASIDDSRYD